MAKLEADGGMTLQGTSWPPPVDTQPTSDRLTFEEFYRAHVLRTRRLCFVLTGSADVAEDMTQEGFARLYRRYGRIDNPSAYLRVTVVNLYRRHARHAVLRRRSAALAARVDHVSSPSTDISDLIERLPTRQRAVLVLRYYEDLTEAEIAEALTCRPGTVKSLAARALARLREELSS